MKKMFFTMRCFVTMCLIAITGLSSFSQVDVVDLTYDPLCGEEDITIKIAERNNGDFKDMLDASPPNAPTKQFYTIGFSSNNDLGGGATQFEFVLGATVHVTYVGGAGICVVTNPIADPSDISKTQFTLSYTMSGTSGDKGYFLIEGLRVKCNSKSNNWVTLERINGPTPLANQQDNAAGDETHARLRSRPMTAPTVTAQTDACLTPAGVGYWEFSIPAASYDPTNYTYELYITGKVPLTDLGGGNFRNNVVDASAPGNSRTYYLKVISKSNTQCSVNSANMVVNFHSNGISEKGTGSSPVIKILKYSEGRYILPNSDIFNNLTTGITWTFSSPYGTGIFYDAGKSNWVIDPTRFTSGFETNYGEISYTAEVNGCTVSGVLNHTKFQIFDDKATLPPFIRSISAMPICENAGSAYLYASVNPTCLLSPTSNIIITATYYDKATATFSDVPVTGYYIGKDPYSTNSLFYFWIYPGRHYLNSIPITIASVNGSGSGCTSTLYSGKIPIYPANTPTLSGVPAPVTVGTRQFIHLCSASQDTISMRANPSGGTYIFNLLQPNGFGGYSYHPFTSVRLAYKNYLVPPDDPSLIKFIPADVFKREILPNGASWVIRVYYYSPEPCPDYIERFFIFDPPVSTTFTTAKDTICYGDTLNLGVSPGNNLGNKFLWDFGDGINTGFVENDTIEHHFYEKPGKYKLRFRTMLTTLPPGMCNNDVIDTIWVGAKPRADFDVARNFENVKARFHSKSDIPVANISVSDDVVNKWQWKFGNPTLVTSTSVDTFNVFNTYLKDPYQIVHIATAKWGCVDSAVHHIPVFPIKTLTTANYSLDTFRVNDVNGWYESGQYKVDTLSSWVNQTPAGNKIQGGTESWMTWKNNSKGAGYYNNEKSYVESPVYDIAALSLPMVSLDTWINADNLFDGASLQYTFCDSVAFGNEKWYTLGDVGQGLEWYNSQTVIGSPGGKLRGWTNDTCSSWKLSAYRITQIRDSLLPPKNHKLFRFRVVLGTNGDNTPGKTFDGFAFDNFFVGQRNRKILVEEFCDYSLFEPLMKAKMVDPQAVRIQYHVRTRHSDDDINNANMAEPSARALHYGVDNIPVGVIDGIKKDHKVNFLTWGEDAVFKRSLIQAPFDINITNTPDIVNKKLNVSATVTKNTNVLIEGPFLVHIAIVEKEVFSNSLPTPFTNVLRSMLPSAAGQRIEINWLKNHSETFNGEWTPFVKPESKLYVVAFIQDDATKEVYQVNLDSIDVSIAELLYNPARQASGTSSFNDVTLFPNPTTGKLSVLLNGITEVENNWVIIDALGNILLSGKFDQGVNLSSIDASALPLGVYHLIIDAGGAVVNKNFSVIR